MDSRIKDLLIRGRMVVDLGCGSGQLLAELTSLFDERIGLDVSRRRLDKAGGNPMNWRFCEADLNNAFPLGDGSADAVVANQVIEHIVNPIKFAREIHRLLRPGGRCIITTPNIRYLLNIAYLLLSGSGPRTAGRNTLDGEWDDGHLHYFTHKDLHEIFYSVGFSTVQSRALINSPSSTTLRRMLDLASTTKVVREFLSGNILLWAIK